MAEQEQSILDKIQGKTVTELTPEETLEYLSCFKLPENDPYQEKLQLIALSLLSVGVEAQKNPKESEVEPPESDIEVNGFEESVKMHMRTEHIIDAGKGMCNLLSTNIFHMRVIDTLARALDLSIDEAVEMVKECQDTGAPFRSLLMEKRENNVTENTLGMQYSEMKPN